MPTSVETDYTLLSATPNVIQLVASDDGLYWHDGTTIWALPRGQAAPSVLYAYQQSSAAGTQPVAGQTQPAITGLLADAGHVYWSEGSYEVVVDLGFVAGPPPPGRLLSVPQAGGPVQVLLDSSAPGFRALGVDGSRVIVRMGGVDAGFYAFNQLDRTLSRLAAPADPYASIVRGDQIYWSEPEGEEDGSRLLRAQLDATEAKVLARIEDSTFDVGPGYVLWRHDHLVTQPELLLQQNLVIWRDDTGCVQSLPGAGESISYGTALDARHAYWHSFNGLGAVSMSVSSDGRSTVSPLPEVSLVRLDLQNGALEQLEVAGFHSTLGDQILGLDTEHLFIATPDGLVAIRTP
ncbi:MAG: hypothetical protein ABI895_31300 [Deltaproteobacteria bacterium]